MATDLERAAKEAYVDDDFELALDFYTRALDLDPCDAHLLADRAQANLKLENFAGTARRRAISLVVFLLNLQLKAGAFCLSLSALLDLTIKFLLFGNRI